MWICLAGLILILGCTPTNIVDLPTQIPARLTPSSLPATIQIVNDLNTSPPQPSSTSVLPTLPATLPIEKRETEVAILLSQQDDECKLPCWWGLIPGITSWTTTKQFLAYLNAKVAGYTLGKNVHYFTELSRPDSTYSLQVDFSVREDRVTGITITAMDSFDLVKFKNDWRQYQPLRVLQEYGTPSRIWIETAGLENNAVIGGLLFFFYDQLGFLITYQSGGQVTSNSYRFCPQIETAIYLFLQSPSDPTPLDGMAESLIDREFIYTIEQATGLSIEESYDQLLAEGCFETTKMIGP
jgi:hypothetical protein